MNTKHIKALLDSAHTLSQAYVDGQAIISNGHFAVITDSLPEDNVPKNTEALTAAWKGWLRDPPILIIAWGCYKAGKYIVRKIGADYVNEAYFRAFNGDSGDITFAKPYIQSQAGPLGAIRVYKADQLIGAIMPMAVKEPFSPCDPTDEEVFESFACEANSYYLQDDKFWHDERDEIFQLLTESRKREEDARTLNGKLGAVMKGVEDGAQELLEDRDKLRQERDHFAGRVKTLEDVLSWMNRKGGLGIDVHERIEQALAAKAPGI